MHQNKLRWWRSRDYLEILEDIKVISKAYKSITNEKNMT